MCRALILAALVGILTGAAPGQAVGVLHIKVTLTDASRASTPVAGHALLVSDNPATSTPRRVVTAADGTANVRLAPGNYTVESDEPFGFDGKGYGWTQTVQMPAGRDLVLELTAANAEVGAAPPPSSAPARPVSDASLAVAESPDSAVTIWTPQARASGVLVDAAGLVVTSQRLIDHVSAIEVQLTPSIKVAARVLAADQDRDVAVLWFDPASTASSQVVPLGCESATTPPIVGGRKAVAIGSPHGDVRNVAVDDVCEVVRAAVKAMSTVSKPAATRLPVEQLQKFPADKSDAAAQARGSSLNLYQMSSSDFDVTFLTPVLIAGQQRKALQSNSRYALPQGVAITPTDFGDWSDYFTAMPAVLAVRVTPKLTESFWTSVARGAAYTQGVALPPIKHFKPGFSRLRVYCGDVEVTPIHPFTLEQRVSETDAIREGLYVFDPRALGPHCKSVRLVLFSEKEPEKADSRTVDPQLIERVWQDFAPFRALAGPAI